jgi:hypothetical protein
VTSGRNTGRSKRRTRSHVIADLAVHHVEGHVLRCGYTTRRIAPDYGLDLTITTYSKRGEVESGLIWLQVKGTDHPQRPKGQAVIAVRIEYRDLLSWIGEQYPVVLGIYDAIADKAYWIHVQAEFAGGKIFAAKRRGSHCTIHVPLGQVLNEQAIQHFRQLKIAAISRWL